MYPKRFVTAASLFDGHDVSINIMRRILQSKGVEVIHLGHNRSAEEVVKTAIEEDAHALALSSYQGGHVEYFSYVRELLDQRGAKDIKIFGGGGGVITEKERNLLHSKGITRIYSPKDGTELGLEGIVQDMIDKCVGLKVWEKGITDPIINVSKGLTYIEEKGKIPYEKKIRNVPVIGITGTGGAGKSSLIDELLLRFTRFYPSKKLALISVDPTRKRTQGALLGDRIRMNCAHSNQIYMRSVATRNSSTELSLAIPNSVDFLKMHDFDLIIVETSGIGQGSDEITKVSDLSLYVMTPEFGAQGQLEKIEMLQAADFVTVNKYEKRGGEDAVTHVRKQVQRNHKLFHLVGKDMEQLNVFGTSAHKFNDKAVNGLFYEICKKIKWKGSFPETFIHKKTSDDSLTIIEKGRENYLYEIAATIRKYNKETSIAFNDIKEYESLCEVEKLFKHEKIESLIEERSKKLKNILEDLDEHNKRMLAYKSGEFKYSVRKKEISIATKFETLSGLNLPKVGIPNFTALCEHYRFMRNFNLPGFFPFAGGIFPFKRADEDPRRQFAGEGGPQKTNKRFHFLSKNDPFKRLSTAFDSVTLYGEDPDKRPDIYGKIGESGVSICTLDDMKKLFEGFKLTDPKTSVSMTINGPAPIILAMFLNTAIDQELSNEERKDPDKVLEILRKVRGTVQADILKEDQAQNTCIFSLEFALKMMGDVQEFFCNHDIKNYYTVSVSGYHIAEAGANPITQLAFTLANGMTLLEYYLSRGMDVDKVCQNMSFFFSNGLDPEYTVLGSVARKIWAIAIKDFYKGNDKSQKLKYHIQTSGRSLHAQEIDFNDIRTTLQSFLAISDNCNSLHTNAYDEAITTPTEESVRRSMAIQMIINKEFGLNKIDNPLQGSFAFNELCSLVEEKVLEEFERISLRGGVLGAMETMYQRSKIQEESHYYEVLKDNGKLPIVGVNTFKNPEGDIEIEVEMSRSTNEEKDAQIERLKKFHVKNKDQSQEALNKLKVIVDSGGNIFSELMNTVRYCSLGEITHLLFEVGGKYRRNT